MEMPTNNTENIENLSSRRLWDLINTHHNINIKGIDKDSIIQELIKRKQFSKDYQFNKPH